MIKLTKEINGKKVELDVISLNGKAVVRNDCFSKLKLDRAQLKEAGLGLESDELDIIKAKKSL